MMVPFLRDRPELQRAVHLVVPGALVDVVLVLEPIGYRVVVCVVG